MEKIIPAAINILTTSRGKVTIRPALTSDVIQFSGLRLQALRENPAAFGSSYEERVNCSRDWWVKTLQTLPDEEIIFVAEHRKKLVAMTGFRTRPGRKTGHGATIWGVFIQPEWRGLGILAELFNACFAWAQKRHINIIKLAVVTTNQPAVNAYQRLGFQIYGTEPKVIFYDGKYYDEYLMFIELHRVE